MSHENITVIHGNREPDDRARSIAEALAISRPRPTPKDARPRPIVSSAVDRNTYYPLPMNVRMDVKAATPEEALTALAGAYAGVQAQLKALIDSDAERAGEQP